MMIRKSLFLLTLITAFNSFASSPIKSQTEIKMNIEKQVKNGKTPGIQYVAVSSDEVLVEKVQGLADIKSKTKLTESTQLLTYSMTKTFIAVLVLRLQEQGKLNIENKVGKYLTDQPYGEKLQIKHLLNQTSGIPSPIPLKWAHLASEHKSFNEKAIFWKRIKENPELDFEPGEKYSYSNLSYAMLGQIIEKVSSKSLEEVFQTEINSPLGIDAKDLRFDFVQDREYATGYLKRWSMINFIKYFMVDKKLYDKYENGWLQFNRHLVDYKAMGGLISNAKTVSIFLQDLLSNDSKLLNKESKKLLFQITKNNKGEDVEMTLGWHIGKLDGKTFYFKEGGGAGYHCEMRMYPELDLATVVMTNSTTFDVKGFLNEMYLVAKNQK